MPVSSGGETGGGSPSCLILLTIASLYLSSPSLLNSAIGLVCTLAADWSRGCVPLLSARRAIVRNVSAFAKILRSIRIQVAFQGRGDAAGGHRVRRLRNGCGAAPGRLTPHNPRQNYPLTSHTTLPQRLRERLMDRLERLIDRERSVKVR